MHYDHVDLHNVQAVFPAEDGGGLSISRIPLDLREQLNPSAYTNALQSTGCEVRFNLEGESARIVLEMEEHPAVAEVYFGPFLAGWYVIQTQPTAIDIVVPERMESLVSLHQDRAYGFDPELVRVVLPWRPPVRIHAIEGEISLPRQDQVPATRYLAYGSSITHGNNTVGAHGMYAQLTARKLAVDFINLGFGGGAHCEAVMADYIATRDDWDFATLELGINLVSWMDASEFAERVDVFIDTVATANPDKWIFCIDMFPFHMDYDPDCEVNHAYRAAVRDAVTHLALPKLVHLDGRDLLRSATGLCADLVHPSPAGMEEIAVNLSQRMQRYMDDANNIRLV